MYGRKNPGCMYAADTPSWVHLSLQLRQIDCVTVKGSTQPMGLFTYDICLEAVPEPDLDSGFPEDEDEMWWVPG